MKINVFLWLVFTSGFCFAGEEKLPDGASFMGLSNDGSWYGYIFHKGNLTRYSELKNAQELTYSAETNSIYFVSAENKIMYLDLERSEISEIRFSNGVTRLSGIKMGRSRLGKPGFYGVSLVDGNSKNTEVVFYDPLKNKFEVILSPRLSVYDPMIRDGKIAYTAITCVESCEQPSQELWVKHIEINNAKQLTLLGSYLKMPFIADSGRMIYFSRPYLGSTSIWKYDLQENIAVQVTHDKKVKDSNPVWENGKLYFIRQSGSGSEINVMVNSKIEKIAIPGVSKIRDFEVLDG